MIISVAVVDITITIWMILVLADTIIIIPKDTRVAPAIITLITRKEDEVAILILITDNIQEVDFKANTKTETMAI